MARRSGKKRGYILCFAVTPPQLAAARPERGAKGKSCSPPSCFPHCGERVQDSFRRPRISESERNATTTVYCKQISDVSPSPLTTGFPVQEIGFESTKGEVKWRGGGGVCLFFFAADAHHFAHTLLFLGYVVPRGCCQVGEKIKRRKENEAYLDIYISSRSARSATVSAEDRFPTDLCGREPAPHRASKEKHGDKDGRNMGGQGFPPAARSLSPARSAPASRGAEQVDAEETQAEGGGGISSCFCPLCSCRRAPTLTYRWMSSPKLHAYLPLAGS